jgi:hypothetical protein
MSVPANTKVKYRFYTSVVLLEMLKLRDACSGVAKAAMTRAVKGGTIILNAMQMFNFANDTLTRDTASFKRSFYMVTSEDINRDKTSEVKAVNGIRKLHSVRSVAPFIIRSRKLPL